MKIKHTNSEKGQVIVYLVIGFVVFLGFVALAIDGGMALADRRHSQNVADSASLAGGAEAAQSLEQSRSLGYSGVDYDTWNCSNGTPVESAKISGENTAITRA